MRMSKQSTTPNLAPAPVMAAPADFYQADQYNSDNSIGYLMRRIMLTIVNQADKRLESLDLTQAQWGPLFLLLQGRASTLAELSRELQIDPGALTRTLDRLESKGLCKRERSVSDRRVVNLALTPEGREASAHVPEVLADVHNHLLAGFTHEEWQTLMFLLRRVLANAEAMRDGCEFQSSACGLHGDQADAESGEPS